MPGHHLTVAYTGRPELDCCRKLLETFTLTIDPVPIDRHVDLGISIAGTHLFTRDEISLAQYGIVNLHLAPLPEYRGRYSATHAILNGAPSFGAALHYVDEGIDTGLIIGQRRFQILESETAGSLRANALVAGELLFAEILPDLIRAAHDGRRLHALPQDESKAHYYDRHSLPHPNPSDPLMVRALTC